MVGTRKERDVLNPPIFEPLPWRCDSSWRFERRQISELCTNGLGGAIIWNINEGYLPGASNPNGLLAAVRKAFVGGVAGSPTAAFGFNAAYLAVSFTDQSSD